MLKAVAKWSAFLIAILGFLSSVINISDSLAVMPYSAPFGAFGLAGAGASAALFCAVMFGILHRKAWTLKSAVAAAGLNTAYLVILGFVPVPAEMLPAMGAPDAEAVSRLMWMFVAASASINILMAGLLYFCRED